MPRLHVLRVFTAEDGSAGNPLGVVLEGGQVEPAARQPLAAELGFSEIVFVDDAHTGELQIFTPTEELPLAGHPLVGTAWLLARERGALDTLRPPAGEVPARVDGEGAWISAPPDWGPPWDWKQLASPAEVDALEGPLEGHDLIGYWAWIDEPAGIVRARVFPVRIGIIEDEATGGAALFLGAEVGRPLEIHQGAGSVIHARPGPGLTVEIGGRVVLDEEREL